MLLEQKDKEEREGGGEDEREINVIPKYQFLNAIKQRRANRRALTFLYKVNVVDKFP